MRSPRLVGLVLGAASALALVACGAEGDGSSGTSEVPSPTGAAGAPAPVDLKDAQVPPCAPPDSRAFTGGSEDDPALVVTLGTGERGVVLAPQNDADACQWAGQMQRLADQGYAVASFDWPQDDAEGVHAAVAALRRVGAEDVALIGASKGGTYVAALAGDMQPAPVGVVALGPPDQFDLDARSESSAYTGPLLVIASTDDPSVDVERSALVARADDPATFVELPGRAHGVALFESEHQATVEEQVDTFLATSFGR